MTCRLKKITKFWMNLQVELHSENDFIWDGECHTIAEITALKQAELITPGKFLIRNHRCNGELLRAIMEIFEYFAEKQVIWEWLELDDNDSFEMDDDSECQYFVRPLLITANMLSVFKRLKIAFFTEGLIEPVGDLILAGVNQNTQLEAVNVAYGISKQDFDPLIRLLETTTTLKELTLGAKLSTKELPRLCKAMSRNKTLERIELDLETDYITDQEFSGIIAAVAEHPKIHAVSFKSGNCFGPATSRAVRNLLAQNRLHTLKLHFLKINVEDLVQGLKYNTSMKRMDLQNALDDDPNIFSKLFGVLKDCSLESMSLQGVDIQSQDLQQVVSMKRLPKQILLNLDSTVIDQFATSVENVLRAHPEIQLHNMYIIQFQDMPESFQHIYDLNWHGRYLLDRKRIPLALWPLVLGQLKILYAFDNGEASATYRFLKGPVLAQRENLDFGRYLIGYQPALPLSVWPKVLEKANFNATAILQLLNGPAFLRAGL